MHLDSFWGMRFSWFTYLFQWSFAADSIAESKRVELEMGLTILIDPVFFLFTGK